VTDAELYLVRLDAAGQVEHVAQCGGTFVEVRGTRFNAGQPANASRAEGCSPVGGGQDRYRFGGGGRAGLPVVDVKEWLVECGRPRRGRLFWEGTEVDW